MNTFITGAWDIKRGDLDNTEHNYAWKRSFDVYLNQLDQLLSTGLQFIVFGDNNLREICDKYKNALFVYKPLSEVEKKITVLDKIEAIRTSKEWYDQPSAQWLKSSPQAQLKYYIPITMNKLYLIQEASIINPYKSNKFFWVDCGMTRENDIHALKNFEHNLSKYNKFVVMTQTYTDNTEIHGFLRSGMNKYCNVNFVNRIIKAPFFGGSIDKLDDIIYIYEKNIRETLNEGLLGTEETYLTICFYQRPDLFDEVYMPHPGRNNVRFL